MILTNKSIKRLELVRNESGGNDNYRAASYDLTVGTIVTPDGDTNQKDYALPPQGVVKVISAERIVLPPNVTAYVHVKTALCNEGVLALNIGIVDPCWDGPLQSTLLNFGKVKHRIHQGSVFGRITFHLHRQPENPKVSAINVEKAQRDAQSHVDKFLAADFLDFSRTVKEAAKEATHEYRNILLWFVPGLALLLTLFTYLLNFSNMHRLEGYISIKDRAMETEEISDLKAAVKRLSDGQDQLLKQTPGAKEPTTDITPKKGEQSPPQN
jgi:deoxycytidine triphosphate deaminase